MLTFVIKFRFAALFGGRGENTLKNMDSRVLRKPQQLELCADFSLVLEEQRCMMKPKEFYLLSVFSLLF